MKTPGLCALLFGGVALVGCSQATGLSRFQYTPNVNSVAGERGTSVSYRVLYAFKKPPDGNYPEAAVIDVNGMLYGTTSAGGANNLGTVFRVTGTGTEKVIHSFGKGTDGSIPLAGLIGVGGTYYGTTYAGGKYCAPSGGCGTVFSITTGGTEKVLHSFSGSPYDGSEPVAALTSLSGHPLFGTTATGGAYNGGTIFSITTTGTEKELDFFGTGYNPSAALIVVGSKLYGTTSGGGAYNCGTVFSITTTGARKVLYSFGKGTDGCFPQARLTDVKGTLYGTTRSGGKYGRGSRTSGTVFSITTAGTEKVLHSFGNGIDGRSPVAALTYLGGRFYGTTAYGGAYDVGSVFSITTGGTEKVLHSFGELGDGISPVATMFDETGTLVGTTAAGGYYGYGTVFSLTP